MGLRNLWFTLIAVLWCGRFLPQAVGFGAAQAAGGAAATWAAATRRAMPASSATPDPAVLAAPDPGASATVDLAASMTADLPAQVASSHAPLWQMQMPNSPSAPGRTMTTPAIAGPA